MFQSFDVSNIILSHSDCNIQPSQNRPVNRSMSHLLRKFDRLLPVRKCLIVITTGETEKKKDNTILAVKLSHWR